MFFKKTILKLLFLSLILLLPLKLYASESSSSLFLYEDEIIQQVSQKKEAIQNLSTKEIFKQKAVSKPVTNYFYTQTVLSNLKKEILEYDIPQRLLSYIPKEKETSNQKSFEEYISIIKTKEKESIPILSQLQEYKQKTPLEKNIFVSETYIKNLFTKEEKDFSYFLNRPERKSNQNIYAKKSEEKEKDILATNESEKTIQENFSDSTTVKFTLTILPVRFVYIDSSMEIVKIWNNVKKDDSKYVLKFLDENESEIDPSEDLNAQYFSIIKSIDIFGHGLIYEKGSNLNNYSGKIQVKINENTSTTEEIYTLI